MPRLGLAMAEGTVVEWHARPGEAVTRGHVLLTVQSEKAQVEVEAAVTGVLAAIYVEPGGTVPVGALLAAITAPGEPFDAAAFAAAFVPAVPPSASPAAASSRPQGAPAGVARPVAPAARALARRLGLDLGQVTGTGPGGRITVEDVERAASDASLGLEFAVAGTGPTVLLVNGWGVDASAWRPQVEALPDAFAVVTYEHRGIGRSRPVGGAKLTIAGLAEDAHALLAHLGRAPAIVVGASLGAAVALELALRHPETVRALVLLSPPFLADARLLAVLASWPDAPDARVRALLPWLLGRAFLAHDGRREAAIRAWRTMAARISVESLRHHADALGAWLGSRAGTVLPIDVAAVIAAGDDDVLTPPDHARALAAALPHARLEIVPGAGHALALERPAAVVEIVRDLAR
jgi:pyruvate dehydrogenase E2 component (dihydrolipoamide acetyltransferase)